MSVTSALAAATSQILALYNELLVSNCRFVQGQDVGSLNAPIIQCTPAPTSYGPDLLVLADISQPNTSTTPNLGMPGLGFIPAQSANGGTIPAGAMAGKCLFGFTSTNNGYVARLLFSQPTFSVPQLNSGPGVDVANGAVRMNVSSLDEQDFLQPNDVFPFGTVDTSSGNFLQTNKTKLSVLYQSISDYLTANNFLPTASVADFTQFVLPGNVNIPNSTLTVLSLIGYPTNPFGVGDSGGFSFSKSGMYTIDMQVAIQVNTTRNDAGGSAAQARFYTAVQANLNGNRVFNGTQAGSSDNYTGVAAFTGSFTRYFNVNDRVVFQAYGTGDSYQSGGAAYVTPTTISISSIVN